jgi:hypothetical protein
MIELDFRLNCATPNSATEVYHIGRSPRFGAAKCSGGAVMNRLLWTALLAGLSFNIVAVAQTAQRGRPGGSRLPAVGSTLPDVTVFDSEGHEFSTKTLREHYSVLVFGCLT